ncbi:MAG: hypothetical protein A2Z97_07165 [Bdellovibrionales bacterium GWB1_52_6]|nr:MAG: hypothetical protein A2Z97_07165 [Bdellovibrionales bacterium GWB1_52_6]OFZ04294.1 MAG: hypothetical protein A2X97_06510 [Bdellovibrionales bacterium GWA1_52_35]HCM40857.1 transketolase [Bdellovibrionales bacterium]
MPELKPKSTRQAFGEALATLAEAHPEIVVLDADLSKSTKTDIFARKFPERFFEMGIAEANMIGTAAGLAFAGKLPFACSFGCFLTGRYDPIRMSVVYSQANVRLVGTHAGVGIGDDGHSQMGIEDVALMRALPTMGVFQPMDARETELLMNYLVNDWTGPAYLRLTRQNLPNLFPAGSDFEPGKLMNLNPEVTVADVICIASGATVAEAVGASQLLQARGVDVSVWNAHCLKPFDRETLQANLGKAKLIVSVEDHSVIGGLGSCVSEVLSELTRHPPLVRLGIQDVFGESGDPTELYDIHGISAKSIAQTVLGRLKEHE